MRFIGLLTAIVLALPNTLLARDLELINSWFYNILNMKEETFVYVNAQKAGSSNGFLMAHFDRSQNLESSVVILENQIQTIRQTLSKFIKWHEKATEMNAELNKEIATMTFQYSAFSMLNEQHASNTPVKTVFSFKTFNGNYFLAVDIGEMRSATNKMYSHDGSIFYLPKTSVESLLTKLTIKNLQQIIEAEEKQKAIADQFQ